MTFTEEFFRDLSFVVAEGMQESFPEKSIEWKLQRATYIVAKIFDELEKTKGVQD